MAVELVEKEVSTYNEANLQIMRLHQLWESAESKASSGQLLRWAWVLDGIWRELYADVLRSAEMKELKKEYEQLNKLIGIAMPRNDKNKQTVNPYANSLYGILNKKHQFLKSLQDKANKGGSYESATEEDFD